VNNVLVFIKKEFTGRGNFLCLIMLVAALSAAAQQNGRVEKTDTMLHSFPFEINRSYLNLSDPKNAGFVRELNKVITHYYKYHEIKSIDISACASMDGKFDFNRKLADSRAEAVRSYLIKTYPFLRRIPLNIVSGGENWTDFRMSVAEDKNVPLQKELLAIIDDDDLSYDRKEAEIRRMGGGETYRYLADKILPWQRRGDLRIVFVWKTEFIALKPLTVMPVQISPLPEPRPVMTPVPAPMAEPEPVKPPEKFWLLKTNLLYLGAGVSNIGGEIPLGNHFSLDATFTFSPYTVKSNWRIRTLTLQPELRWWPGKQMQGHFLGLHAHTGYYNISLNRDDRWQDKDGDTPLWGAGLSYGYAFKLGRRWRLELVAGAGYANLVYDTFYNVQNGAKYATETKNYWGITRAGITLAYRFDWKR
jgi:hypothetical protein